METTDLTPMLEDLKDNVDDLEENLAPLLKTNLSDITSKLLLLDRAKLHVLVTYGIESIIFAYLKLNGVDAKQHPVFQELARVKQYFDKIKNAENAGPDNQKLRLDKDAAGRFIKGALTGNDKYDQKRSEQQSKEREHARKQFEAASDQVGTSQRFRHLSKKRKADDSASSSQLDGHSTPSATPKSVAVASAVIDQAPEAVTSEKQGSSDKKKKKKKHVDRDESAVSSEPMDVDIIPEHGEVSKQKKKKKKHDPEKEPKMGKSHKPPKSGNAVFQQLLNKPPGKQQRDLDYG